uniref:Uncharacterized protein n=1 Tax=Peronospora matthiolae TaxID=2874970 RepID=A0AAV1VL28_9STRA
MGIPMQVAVELVYTSDSCCRSASDLPSSSDALVTSLLPTSAAFRGNVQLTKADHGDGCALYLSVKGTTAADTDVYDVARSVHEQVKELLSINWLKNISLARASVAPDEDKKMQVSLTTGGTNAGYKSVLTVQQGACTDLLDALESGADVLLPRHVKADALEVKRREGADADGDCVVSLDVDARAPQLGEDVGAFQLLKAVDETMGSFFAGRSTPVALASATVQLHLKPAEESDAMNVAQTVESVDAKLPTDVTFNAPSYNEAVGIFALLAALAVVMMGVMFQKKRNDRRSRERYERANRSAQIRRVSIRMSQHDHDESREGEDEGGSLL